MAVSPLITPQNAQNRALNTFRYLEYATSTNKSPSANSRQISYMSDPLVFLSFKAFSTSTRPPCRDERKKTTLSTRQPREEAYICGHAGGRA